MQAVRCIGRGWATPPEIIVDPTCLREARGLQAKPVMPNPGLVRE
jgi:hypothetical protein